MGGGVGGVPRGFVRKTGGAGGGGAQGASCEGKVGVPALGVSGEGGWRGSEGISGKKRGGTWDGGGCWGGSEGKPVIPGWGGGRESGVWDWGGSTGSPWGLLGAAATCDSLTTPPRCRQEKEKAQKGKKTEAAPSVRGNRGGKGGGGTITPEPPVTLGGWGEPGVGGMWSFWGVLVPWGGDTSRAPFLRGWGWGGSTFPGPPIPLPGLFLTPRCLGP